MADLELFLSTEQETIRLAQRFASLLKPPFVLALSGEIGVGKTTFVRALLQAFGETSSVKSPTYSLIESYECHHFDFYHMDLYRIQTDDELEYLGFREHFHEHAICCIEWPERVQQGLIPTDLQLSFILQPVGRQLLIHPLSSLGERLCGRLREMQNEAPLTL